LIDPQTQAMKTHSYSNGEIKVIWTPEKCIHSTHCWKQLRAVFDPGKRPWIKIDGAPTAHIIQQVEHCPSGALTWEQEPSTPSHE
jgi:uncharacterized Fe-S cluster protein YjdI